MQTENESAELNKAIAPYEGLLQSYANHQSLPRDSLGMWEVERALYRLIKKGVTLPGYLLVGVAGVIANLGTSVFVMGIVQTNISQKLLLEALETIKQENIDKTTRWLLAHQPPPVLQWWDYLVFWRHPARRLTETEMRALLAEPVEEHARA